MADQDLVPFKLKGADGVETDVMIPRAAVFEAVKDTHVAKDRIDTDLNRRVQSIIKNQGYVKPDDLLTDAEFALKVAEAHGLIKKTDGTDGATGEAARKQLQDALTKQKDQLTKETIEPLQKQLTDREARENALLARDRDRQLHVALRDAGAKKALVEAMIGMMRDQVAYDEDTGEFYVADANDNFVLSTGSGSNTYKTIEELVYEFAEKPENADFFDKAMQSGAGVGAGARRGAGGEPGTVTLTEEQASDTPTWARALAQVNGDVTKIRVKKNIERSNFF